MSALFDKLLGVFRKRGQASSEVAPNVLMTPEKISERLHHRPVRHHPSKGVSLAESAGIVFAVEPAPPSLEHEFAIADTSVHEVQQPFGEPWREAEPPAVSDIEIAAARPIEIPAPTIATQPEPTLTSAEEDTWAEEEDEPPTVEAPLVERLPVQQTSRAQPSAEILAEFHAVMRRHFGREEPMTVGAGQDVLKILKLDDGEPIRTSLSVPVSQPDDTPPPFPAQPEIDIPAATIASDPEPIVIALDHVAIDENSYAADQKNNSYAADQKNAPIAWKDRTVAEVILEGDCSVRLANCIAANQDCFSDWTIGEALDHRSEFTAVLMHVRSLGRKTAGEALDALDAFALDPKPNEEEPAEVEEPNVADPLFGFVPAKLNAPLGEVLVGQSRSVRLANVAASGQLDGLTVRDFVLDPDVVRKRLLDCKNAGRKTADEAVEFLAAHVRSLALPDVEHEAPMRTDGVGSERLSTGEWIRLEVASLMPKQAEVLHGRYGLDGGAPQTLQEIAERVHVTRERVRQVEAKALKRLRGDGRSQAAFGRYLADERDAQWTVLFGSESTILDDEVSERFRRIDPWFALAIDILFEDGRKGYLQANAHRTATGWFKNSNEADERQKLEQVIGDIMRSYRTPMPLATLEEIATSVVSPLPAEGDTWTVHDGYIFTGHLGSKARRTGRMHAIARRIAQSGMFDMGTLIAEYRLDFPEDDCGSRMFEMQANEAPNLFAPLFDGIWLCLDRNSRQVDPLHAPPFSRRRVDEPHFAEGSMGSLLIDKLREFGPQRMIDLRRDIVDNGRGSFSSSSVGVVLISNPCFKRIAPGIFGLYTEGPEMSVALDTHLLEDRHCRLYCHARHSGAPSGYYPAWGPGYEMRLSSWARRHAPPELYHSLMAVIEPGSWPAPPETVAEFQTLRERDGQWQLGGSRRHGLGQRFLDSAQFFSVLTHLVTFGWIGWFAVNRVTGTISSNHHAIDVLAFLVMTGLVEPESDWQAPHYPTDLARRLFVEARWERHLHGVESSGEDAFGRLRSALYEAPPTASRGWVDVEEFTAAMPAWRSDGISTGKAFGGAQPRPSGINAEESFESDDWDAVFGA